MENYDVISIIVSSIVWLTIISLVVWQYKKLALPSSNWKVFVIVLIGMLSFSFNLEFYGTVIRIPILPLGVWILYAALRNKANSWQRYRTFAWIGFFALFLFTVTSLLAIPVKQVVYPKGDIATYIANAEDATIIHTHPSAEARIINKEVFEEQLQLMEKEEFDSITWYQQSTVDVERSNVKERFPYQLVGTVSRWGSGKEAIIFLERDGKGLLLTTEEGQMYYRSVDSFLKEGTK